MEAGAGGQASEGEQSDGEDEEYDAYLQPNTNRKVLYHDVSDDDDEGSD